MGDVILIVFLCVIAVVGVGSTVKHFRGEGGCCGGGGGYRRKRKRLSHVHHSKRFVVEGMHCKSCRRRVEEIVNDIDGVAGRVDRTRDVLTVKYEAEVADAILCTKLERAGYTLRSP